MNVFDEWGVERGVLEADQVRSIEVEALADSGATLLCLQTDLIERLGLPFLEERRAHTTNGIVTRKIYLQERTAIFDAVEVPNDCPNLIGQISLERLDFVLDRHGQRIIPNPAHDGELQIELYLNETTH